jgi:hypothetical protein
VSTAACISMQASSVIHLCLRPGVGIRAEHEFGLNGIKDKIGF